MDNPHAARARQASAEASAEQPAGDPGRDSGRDGGPGAGTGSGYDYCKYHGLGNDYLVLEPRAFRGPLSAEQVRALCDRHRGIGADGILWGPLEAAERPPGLAPNVPALRIFNPDGSEAERSGNGLRIFARHLWERGAVPAEPFSLHTPGGEVRVRVRDAQGTRIAVAMGPVSFHSARIPMTGPPREVLNEPLRVGEAELRVSAANVGNPHCVVRVDAPEPEPTPALARALGPLLERHASFPRRTNVQFLRVLGPHAIRIEIWERGAGYTQASGTSSCAAAAVACRLGHCTSPVTVHMPGGALEIRLDAAFNVELEGAVSAVGSGRFADEFLATLGLFRR